MHVYRYRSSNLLSQKGLLYDEWYFASKEELNDPIDMQSKFEFSGDWTRILTSLWENDHEAKIAAAYLTKIGPVSYEQLIIDFHAHKEKIIERVFSNRHVSLMELSKLENSLEHLLALLNLYAPGSGYSISLSRTNSDMLMWSHYAASHTGFCLTYRPINGCLNQCPIRKKDSLAVATNHLSSVSAAFEIEDINYKDQLHPIDAFSLLPVIYTGYSFDSESSRLEYHKKIREQLLTKNKCWQYEQECRLMLRQPTKWISGCSTYNSLQRLFYYDFSQVTGIIFGARMSSQDKEAIQNIISHKMLDKYKNIQGGKTYIFDFLYQQAEICPSSRAVKIVDLDLYLMGSILKPGSAQYADRLDRWRRGEGMAIENGNFSYDPIL